MSRQNNIDGFVLAGNKKIWSSASCWFFISPSSLLTLFCVKTSSQRILVKKIFTVENVKSFEIDIITILETYIWKAIYHFIFM